MQPAQQDCNASLTDVHLEGSSTTTATVVPEFTSTRAAQYPRFVERLLEGSRVVGDGALQLGPGDIRH